jgi:hypothetical protein
MIYWLYIFSLVFVAYGGFKPMFQYGGWTMYIFYIIWMANAFFAGCAITSLQIQNGKNNGK